MVYIYVLLAESECSPNLDTRYRVQEKNSIRIINVLIVGNTPTSEIFFCKLFYTV